MIVRSAEFHLGLDKTRIKDQRDADRQHRTVDELLTRLFHADPERRWELQLVADEVGMGKTFVALAVAYSVLAGMRAGQDEPDLRGCFRKVLIVTPQNPALFAKWRREVSEFVKRCVHPAHRSAAEGWFAPEPIERFDDLAAKLGRRGTGPSLFVTHMGVFAGGRLLNYGVKRRFLLAALFRHWGTRFKIDQRERLLKGAPEEWPKQPANLGLLTEAERQIVPFSEDDVATALESIARADDSLEKLLEDCREIAAPYVRSRTELFKKVEKQLVETYRVVCRELIRSAFPLVIVDEAHNWKNGPRAGANGYGEFIATVAGRARRALLLTATPFQLRPDEMLEILKVGDHLAATPTIAESQQRSQRLQQHRERVIAPVLRNSAAASERFAKAWAALSRRNIRSAELEAHWQSAPLADARGHLRELAQRPGVVDEQDVEKVILGATAHLDPSVRQLFREALRLYTYNSDLSAELGALVIRHKRRTLHRAFLVGDEFRSGAAVIASRPDRHVLHGAPGLDVEGDAELPHYLLMRCVSEMKLGRGRSSLGSALTGCYSTLLHSSEGKEVQKRLGESPTGKLYLNLLTELVTPEHDPKHPKLERVVDAVAANWRVGEKTLLFCFRVNTAARLRTLIDERLRGELEQRRQACLGGGEERVRALRSRLTGRDRDLVVLGLDRVLWSFYWGAERLIELPVSADDIALAPEDFTELARVALEHGVDLTADLVDRVFLHRAVEHVVARRLDRGAGPASWRRLLAAVAEPGWVASPYGIGARGEADDDESEPAAVSARSVSATAARGVHSVYQRGETPTAARVRDVAEILAARHARASQQGQISIFDAYFAGPSLWLGPNPSLVMDHPRHPTIRTLHRHLADLSVAADGSFDWESRLLVLQALRRAFLWESTLLRLLPERAEREEAQWGELLVAQFHAAMPGQSESMAERLTVFLEDLLGASGRLPDESSARAALLRATRLKDQQLVGLVTGDTDGATRERVFAGFNSPLLPEVLVCTSVGQEGIDLHRHCRHVIHYDLAWNPAVLEQRTGRTDRIGSKTFRERRFIGSPEGPFLEIGVPYLAGTYDERMYEELRMRAQTFEVLTGGDLAADNAEGEELEGTPNGTSAPLVVLPEAMMNDLRVALHVWQPAPEPPAAVAEPQVANDR